MNRDLFQIAEILSDEPREERKVLNRLINILFVIHPNQLYDMETDELPLLLL